MKATLEVYPNNVMHPPNALRHVSLPIEYSVPGTLLLIVAGRSAIGMLKAGWSWRAFLNWLKAVYA